MAVAFARLERQGLTQRGLVPRRDQQVHFGRIGSDFGQPGTDRRLGLGANEPAHHTLVTDGINRGDRLHLEAGGDTHVRVHVDFGQDNLALALGHQLFQDGPKLRQGPHQEAHRSTTTGTWVERSRTSSSKVASVTSIATVISPPARHAPR